MFKSASQKRVITIILWVIVIFIAVIKLPGVTHLITNLNDRVNEPSQISRSEELVNTNRLKHGWGRQLGRTSTVDVVYNRRNGKITDQQQRQINRRTYRLQKSAREYGIHKITDLNTDRSGTDQLKSKDGSTEMVQLSVDPRSQGANSNVWADEIKSRIQVPALRSSVTSPELLKAAGTRATVRLTTLVTIVGLLLASLAIGLTFKSLVAPIISLITLTITDLTALSLTGNLAGWTGFSEFTPLTILLTILIIGTLMNYIINQAVIGELPKHRDPNNAIRNGLRKIKAPVTLTGEILTLAFGAAALIPSATVRPIAAIGITTAILTIAELTIGPVFISWLGNGILWPSHHYRRPTGHHLWNRLTRLSLWQPLIGLVAIVYFIVPFVYAYRPNLAYGQVNNLSSRSQASRGSNELNAHFTSGKSTPVTIYLKNPQKLNREKTLKPIDDLTTKLQSMPGVNAVYSVTQPGGMPINKYYINHQLNTVNDSLNRDQNQLYRAAKQLKRGKKRLGQRKLRAIGTKLERINEIKGRIPRANLDNQLKSASAGQKASVANKLSRYRNQLQNLNGKLSQLSSSLDNVNGLSNDVKGYQDQIKAVNRQLASSVNQIKRVNRHLNSVYGYLSSLQRSSASHQYFITPDQIEDTDFQQSLINFTGNDNRTTKLQVVFNQAPSTRYNRARVDRVKSEIKTELQGTPLSNAKVALSGVPVQQATVQKNFRSGSIIALLLISGIILLGLIMISRSILSPIFWWLGLVLSTVAGLQITELIIRFTTNQPQFNWQVILSIIGILLCLATVELVPVSLAYRHRQVNLTEWLHETFTDLGQRVTATLLIVTLVSLGLFLGMTYQVAQISTGIIVTAVIFNWVLPTLTSALGKYMQTLPHSKL